LRSYGSDEKSSGNAVRVAVHDILMSVEGLCCRDQSKGGKGYEPVSPFVRGVDGVARLRHSSYAQSASTFQDDVSLGKLIVIARSLLSTFRGKPVKGEVRLLLSMYSICPRGEDTCCSYIYRVSGQRFWLRKFQTTTRGRDACCDSSVTASTCAISSATTKDYLKRLPFRR
jgi:hypothetical protein